MIFFLGHKYNFKDLAWPDDLPVPRGNLDRYEGSRFGTITTLKDLRSEDEWDGYSWPDILRLRNLTYNAVNDAINPYTGKVRFRGYLFHKLILLIIILFYTTFSTFNTFAKEYLKTIDSKPKPHFFEDDKTEDSDETTSETNQRSSDFTDDEEFLAAVESFNRAYSKLYEPVSKINKTPETPQNSPNLISTEPVSSTSTPQLPETQATQNIQCISSDSSAASMITQFRPKKRKIHISDTSDEPDSQVDLTRSKGYVLDSDDSSTIDSVHTSDFDFIDDNDYDPISSDENKKRRKRKRFSNNSLFSTMFCF